MDKNNKNKKNKHHDEVIKLATTSFSKEFIVKDKRTAQKILEHMKSDKSTLKVPSSGMNMNDSFARSEELLKKFRSR